MDARYKPRPRAKTPTSPGRGLGGPAGGPAASAISAGAVTPSPGPTSGSGASINHPGGGSTVGPTMVKSYSAHPTVTVTGLPSPGAAGGKTSPRGGPSAHGRSQRPSTPTMAGYPFPGPPAPPPPNLQAGAYMRSMSFTGHGGPHLHQHPPNSHQQHHYTQSHQTPTYGHSAGVAPPTPGIGPSHSPGSLITLTNHRAPIPGSHRTSVRPHYQRSVTSQGAQPHPLSHHHHHTASSHHQHPLHASFHSPHPSTSSVGSHAIYRQSIKSPGLTSEPHYPSPHYATNAGPYGGSMQSVGSLGNMSTPSLNLAFAGSPHSVNPPASPFTPYTPRMHSSSPLSSRSVVSLDMKGISRDLAGPTSGLPSALLGGTLGDGKSSSGGGGLGTSGGSGSGPAAGSGVGGSSGSNSGTGPSDDPWTILRANLLPLFNGDEPPRRIEELGQLVRACMQTCKNAHALIHDIRELLTMGCLTLLAKLQSAPDERLIQRLGEVWHAFARMTLPRLEGVFLPLHTVEVSTVTARPSRVRANSSSSVKSGTATGTGGGGGNSSISATIVPTTAAAVGPHPQYQNFSVRQDILLCLRNLVVVPIYHRIEAALARAMATDGDALLKVNQYIPRIFQMLAMLSFLHTDDENQFLVDRVWAQVRHMFLHLPETQ